MIPVLFVTFEVYTEDFWVEFEIATNDPEAVIANLRSLPNTRNIVRH